MPDEKNPLTPREVEVLAAVTEYGSRQDAANALGISVRTVSSHLRAIYRRLDTHSTAQAYQKASNAGWL